MPRMMVSMASGSCFMKRFERRPPRNFTKRSTRNMPEKRPGRPADAERPPEQRSRRRRARRRRPARRRRRSPPTSSSPARRKLARSRVVSSSGMNFASASVSVTRTLVSCFWRSSISRASSRSSRPDMRLRPTRARRLRCRACIRRTTVMTKRLSPIATATEATKIATATIRLSTSHRLQEPGAEAEVFGARHEVRAQVRCTRGGRRGCRRRSRRRRRT